MNDPRHLIEHSRQMMIQQLIRCATPEGMTQVEFKNILDAASYRDVSEYWRVLLGDLCEAIGV